MKQFSTYSWAVVFLALWFFSAHSVIAQHVTTKATDKSPACKLYQKDQAISSIGFVQIQNKHREEALFYYENNWKVLRDIALKKDYIQSYELLLTEREEGSDFDIMLITVYKNKAQYEASEANFVVIINAQPEGLKLFNKLQPGDFRKTLFYKNGKQHCGAGL